MGYYSDMALALNKNEVEALNRKLDSAHISEETRAEVQNLLAHAESHYTAPKSGAEA